MFESPGNTIYDRLELGIRDREKRIDCIADKRFKEIEELFSDFRERFKISCNHGQGSIENIGESNRDEITKIIGNAVENLRIKNQDLLFSTVRLGLLELLQDLLKWDNKSLDDVVRIEG